MKILLKKLLALNLAMLMLAGALLNAGVASAAGTAGTVVITYYGNGGTTVDGEETYFQEVEPNTATLLLGPDSFIKDGQILIGWKTDTNRIYGPGERYVFTDSVTLTAQWGLARISYYSNYPVSGITNKLRISTSNSILNGDTYSCEGYSFVGWNTKADGSGEWFTAEIAITAPLGIFNLYAQWEIVSENFVLLDAAGTTALGGKSFEYIAVDSFPAKVTLPGLPDGFVGWSTRRGSGSPDSSPVYSPGETVTFTESTTLYPWKMYNAPYTVLYYGNGGSNEIGSTVYYHSYSRADITLRDVTTFENEGKRIVLWNTKPDGTGVSYAPGQMVNEEAYSDSILTLYAQWESVSTPYITFLGGGGTTSDGKKFFYQDVDSYDSITLPDGNAFTRGKFIFAGWQDEAGEIYLPGQTCSFDGSVVLTAKWDYAHISYYKNDPRADGSSGKDDPFIVSTARTIMLGETFSFEGYSFVGWNTKADGKGTWYPEGQTLIDALGELDLFAQWVKTPENYLCFGANKTSCLDGLSYKYVELDSFPALVELPVPTISGTFIGWTTNLKTLNPTYAAGNTIILTKNTTIYPYAASSSTTYNIIHYGNGGASNSGSTVKLRSATYANLELYNVDTFKKDGYRMTGWNTKADGTGSSYEPGQKVDKTAYDGYYLSLYAQWEAAPNPYITYIGNSGETADGKAYCYQDVDSYDSVTLLGADTFTRERYVFVGWRDELGRLYLPGQTCSLDGPTVLTAQWTYARITYHANSPISGDTGVTHVSTVNSFLSGDVFSFDGYSFVGWNTSANGKGSWYSELQKISSPLGELTLYAQWIKTPEKYLCLAANGTNVLSGRSREYIVFDSFPAKTVLPLIPDTWSDISVGWSTVQEHSPHYTGNQDNELSYAQNTEVTIEKNTTLYAWTTYQYKNYAFTDVIYHGNGGATEIGSTVKVQYTSWASLSLYGVTEFTRDGYRLTGWNTEADGSGVSREPYEMLTYNSYRRETIRLYAQWEEVTDLYVTLMGNGGTTADGKEFCYLNADADGNVTLPKDGDFIREGYSLSGWIQKGSDIGIAAGLKISIRDNITLYATWRPHTVHGDLNRDGYINASDAVLLAQYLAGWDVVVDLPAADCNGNGTVNSADAVLLAQYLAGWSVSLG